MQLVLCSVYNVSILQEARLSGYVRKCPWKKLQKSLIIHLCFTKVRNNDTNIYQVQGFCLMQH
jgi:hypothetical protein